MPETVTNLEFDASKLANITFWTAKKDSGFIISWRKLVILRKKVPNITPTSNMK